MARVFAAVGAAASSLVLAASANAAIPSSIGALESALRSHSTTCVAVTTQALAAIARRRSLRAVLEVNPDALAIARRLDARQAFGRPLLRSSACRCSSRTTTRRPTGSRRPSAR